VVVPGCSKKASTNIYSISRQSWKWTKNLFLHLLDLTIPKQFVLLASCGAKVAHRDFRLTFIKDLIQEAGRFPWIQTAFSGRPTPSIGKLTRLPTEHILAPGGKSPSLSCVFSGKQTNTDEGQVRDMQYRFVLGTVLHDLSYKTTFL
jgi:hypothetical protein